jgi:hypothetical protein
LKQGKEIIEFFINEMEKEGITELPIWQEEVSSIKSEAGSDVDTEKSDSKEG